MSKLKLLKKISAICLGTLAIGLQSFAMEHDMDKIDFIYREKLYRKYISDYNMLPAQARIVYKTCMSMLDECEGNEKLAELCGVCVLNGVAPCKIGKIISKYKDMKDKEKAKGNFDNDEYIIASLRYIYVDKMKDIDARERAIQFVKLMEENRLDYLQADSISYYKSQGFDDDLSRKLSNEYCKCKKIFANDNYARMFARGVVIEGLYNAEEQASEYDALISIGIDGFKAKIIANSKAIGLSKEMIEERYELASQMLEVGKGSSYSNLCSLISVLDCKCYGSDDKLEDIFGKFEEYRKKNKDSKEMEAYIYIYSILNGLDEEKAIERAKRFTRYKELGESDITAYTYSVLKSLKFPDGVIKKVIDNYKENPTKSIRFSPFEGIKHMKIDQVGSKFYENYKIVYSLLKNSEEASCLSEGELEEKASEYAKEKGSNDNHNQVWRKILSELKSPEAKRKKLN